VSRALLDVNVLLALLDSDHADHTLASTWLAAEIEDGWASCAITQNGFVRVISQPAYPSPVPPSQAIERLAEACARPHHEFWSCSASILDDAVVDRSRVHGPRQVTDAYLLALATSRRARLVTLDHAIPLAMVPGARPENLTVL
jgi:toxin-antitoxin system PIN domain toxin